MERKDIISNPGYWITDIQIKLFRLAEEYMHKNGMNRKQLAEHLGVTPGYVTQLLSGDYDNRISKMVELALAFGCVPQVQFEDMERYAIRMDATTSPTERPTFEDRQRVTRMEIISTDYTTIKNDAA